MIDRAKQLWASFDAWTDRHRITRVTQRAIGGFLRHEALVNAGSMAYFTILSLFQILVLAVVLLSFFLGEGGARTYVLDTTVNNTPIDRATAASVIDAVISSRGGISIVSGVLLLWSALAAFSALNKGIARAFVAAAPRPFWRDKLVGLGVMATAGSLTVAAILLGFAADFVVAITGDTVSQVPGGAFALDLLSFLIPILLIFGVFLAVYRMTPNRPVTLREVWPGAIVATILWTLLRIGFTYYSTHIARYDSAFGPISTGVSLLVFLYFASVVVLLGAEVARANVLEDAFERQPSAVQTTTPTPTPGAAQPIRPRAQSEEQAEQSPAPAIGEKRLPRWAMVVGGAVAGGVVRRVSLRVAAWRSRRA